MSHLCKPFRPGRANLPRNWQSAFHTQASCLAARANGLGRWRLRSFANAECGSANYSKRPTLKLTCLSASKHRRRKQHEPRLATHGRRAGRGRRGHLRRKGRRSPRGRNLRPLRSLVLAPGSIALHGNRLPHHAARPMSAPAKQIRVPRPRGTIAPRRGFAPFFARRGAPSFPCSFRTHRTRCRAVSPGNIGLFSNGAVQ